MCLQHYTRDFFYDFLPTCNSDDGVKCNKKCNRIQPFFLTSKNIPSKYHRIVIGRYRWRVDSDIAPKRWWIYFWKPWQSWKINLQCLHNKLTTEMFIFFFAFRWRQQSIRQTRRFQLKSTFKNDAVELSTAFPSISTEFGKFFFLFPCFNETCLVNACIELVE